MPATAELEIAFVRWDDKGSYEVDLRYNTPGQEAPIHPRLSTPVSLKLGDLDRAKLDPVKYGELLSSSLFAADDLRAEFGKCVASAESQGFALRVRLSFSPNAPELHGLRWETLRGPDGRRLATSQQTMLSREPRSAAWRSPPPAPATYADLQTVVAIADGEDLPACEVDGRRLQRLDAVGEMQRARKALEGTSITPLWRDEAAGDPHRQATLSALMARLRDRCDILYLVCHGALLEEGPVLYLEDAAGRVAPVSGSDFVDRLRELQALPRLIVLASCQSAAPGGPSQSGDRGALAAVGPRLVDAGVPAVLAMQDDITLATLALFMPALFRELRSRGEIDYAVAAARSEVEGKGRLDWWVPTLFMRLKEGLIWGGPATSAPGEFDKWEGLVSSLANGSCTALLGSGLLEGLVGSTRETAARLADMYRFPLASHDRDDLPQVAQFLETAQGDRKFPHDELVSYLRRLLRRKFPATVGGQPRGTCVDELLVRACQQLQASNPNEPHAVLSRLPFPVYITTNGDTLLATSLEKDKDKRVRVRSFRSGEAAAPLAEKPSAKAPLVYQLFGTFADRYAMVLTEDDYFRYLLDVGGRRQQILSDVLAALTNSSLLFLGFRLEDWDFRVLVQSIKALEGSLLLQDHAHVAVQLEPADSRFLDSARARHLLEQTRLPGKKLSIFWGPLEDFLCELERRYQAKLREEG